MLKVGVLIKLWVRRLVWPNTFGAGPASRVTAPTLVAVRMISVVVRERTGRLAMMRLWTVFNQVAALSLFAVCFFKTLLVSIRFQTASFCECNPSAFSMCESIFVVSFLLWLAAINEVQARLCGQQWRQFLIGVVAAAAQLKWCLKLNNASTWHLSITKCQLSRIPQKESCETSLYKLEILYNASHSRSQERNKVFI